MNTAALLYQNFRSKIVAIFAANKESTRSYFLFQFFRASHKWKDFVYNLGYSFILARGQ